MDKNYPIDILLSNESYYSLISDVKQLPSLDQLEIPECVTVICPNCLTVIEVEKDLVQVNYLYQGFFDDEDNNPSNWPLITMSCNNCQKCAALYIKQQWCTTLELLHSNNNKKDGFIEVLSPGERLVLWILNQIFLVQYEVENSFDGVFLSTSPQEKAKILWSNGEAIGFYVWKLKGTPCIESCCLNYQLSVIDLIFVRKEFRRRGFCLEAIDDVILMLPNQIIGFSKPISDDLWRVLAKYLHLNPELQNVFWEITLDGSIGNRKNVWYHLKKLGLTRYSETSPSPLSSPPSVN